MEESEINYVKHTQKAYIMSFKLSVVQEVERGEISVTGATRKCGIQGNGTVIHWLRKYGTFDWENQTPSNIPKIPEQKIMELEQKVKLLEKQKSFLEQQVKNADKKALIFDMIIEMAEKEYRIPIRKKCIPEQSTNSNLKKTKR